jgi:hypothetical protein
MKLGRRKGTKEGRIEGMNKGREEVKTGRKKEGSKE